LQDLIAGGQLCRASLLSDQGGEGVRIEKGVKFDDVGARGFGVIADLGTVDKSQPFT
jgi:hypothetical protein